MSPKIPALKPKKVINTFLKFGFQIVRQKGSHVFLKNPDKKGFLICIPHHTKDIKKGLLLKQLKISNIDVELFLKKYK